MSLPLEIIYVIQNENVSTIRSKDTVFAREVFIQSTYSDQAFHTLQPCRISSQSADTIDPCSCLGPAPFQQ